MTINTILNEDCLATMKEHIDEKSIDISSYITAVYRDVSPNEPYFALFRIAIKPSKSIDYVVWELRRD